MIKIRMESLSFISIYAAIGISNHLNRNATESDYTYIKKFADYLEDKFNPSKLQDKSFNPSIYLIACEAFDKEKIKYQNVSEISKEALDFSKRLRSLEGNLKELRDYCTNFSKKAFKVESEEKAVIL